MEQDPIGTVNGANLYQLDTSNPLANVDWLGTQTKPSTGATTQPTFNDVFKGGRSASISLDDLLLGKADTLPDTLTLPPELEAAMAESAALATDTGHEWGGGVTEKNGTIKVWTPAEGGPTSMSTAQISSSYGDTSYNVIGFYHSHPNKGPTSFSKPDVDMFIAGNMRLAFSAMNNCSNTEMRVVVALRSIKRDQKYLYPEQPVTTIKGGVTITDGHAKLDKILAEIAAETHFGFYLRKGTSGALQRVTPEKK